MTDLAATRLSSHGQVVLPAEVREALDLHEGDPLIVAVQGDKIILRKLVLDDPPKKPRRD